MISTSVLQEIDGNEQYSIVSYNIYTDETIKLTNSSFQSYILKKSYRKPNKIIIGTVNLLLIYYKP